MEFLRARFDEDERIARRTTERQPYDEWDAVGDDREGDAARKYWSVAKIARMEPIPAARDLAVHIARHDPARVLREIDAKRQIVAQYVEHERLDRETFDAEGQHARSLVSLRAAYLDAVRELATVYADHPDYRKEWRP
ncbi:DUF6221 family protein [Streptomyces actuosus]|uniref:DUF6221 family protein n=1 Tax=Streptomyces actuosus TaxID=1885 RepID=UPI0013A6B17E|nr:DUF6221 family protein [Streptomyces actuosus]MBM4819735.1 hypothetical protein [Streptomyces actuosus]